MAFLSLMDVARRKDPEGEIDTISELLSQTNEFFRDMTWSESNLDTGHKSTVRTGLPQGTWRVAYAGVPFYHGLSLELGLADLGIYPVKISTTSADIPQAAKNVLHNLSPAGRGVTLDLGGPLDINRWLAIEPHLGLLIYQSKQEVFTPVGTFSEDKVGAGIDAGFSLLLHPIRQVYVGTGLECFDTDRGCNVLLYSGEIEFHWK